MEICTNVTFFLKRTFYKKGTIKRRHDVYAQWSLCTKWPTSFGL